MAYEIPGQRISVRWGTTVPPTTAAQFRMYGLSTAGYAQLTATTADNRPFGVLQDVPPSTAAAGTFLLSGVTKLKVGGSTMTRGEFFACSSAGYAVPFTTDFPRIGLLLAGTSGTTGRIMTALFFGPMGVEV